MDKWASWKATFSYHFIAVYITSFQSLEEPKSWTPPPNNLVSAAVCWSFLPQVFPVNGSLTPRFRYCKKILVWWTTNDVWHLTCCTAKYFFFIFPSKLLHLIAPLFMSLPLSYSLPFSFLTLSILLSPLLSSGLFYLSPPTLYHPPSLCDSVRSIALYDL